ncbi:hypothetical protein G6F58_012902 [Rhizopus delemar]|nr:hypothetical protein G6F58_012902 [Rhizopus delemar]
MSSKTKTANDHVIERDGYAEVTLTRPRQVNGGETAVLRMREPTVEDMERFQDDKGSDAQHQAGSARPGRPYRLGPARNHDAAGVEVHLVDTRIAGTWRVTFKRQRSRSVARSRAR